MIQKISKPFIQECRNYGMKATLLFLLISVQTVFAVHEKVIHVLVALCDNKYQGIVPVPEKIGNGQDPNNNLYWGCGYGVKTFFKKQKEWLLLKQWNYNSGVILERLLFKHKDSSIYIVADAYNGANIKQTIIDLFDYSAGSKSCSIEYENATIKAGGNADLLCYVGHDGLMDFELEVVSEKKSNKQIGIMIFACYSKKYFKQHVAKTGAIPLLWTTHLMCPEAYVLHAAITAWIKQETPEELKEKVAQTYHAYQKCGIKGARNLFVTGH